MAYFARYMLDESGNLRKVVINAGVGFCLPFYGETAPPGTLACDGSEISREAYKELFQVLGTKAGAGDGVSTFNLPDFRGDFIRCVGGNAAELGVEQGDAIRNITGSWSFRRLFASGNQTPWNALTADNVLYHITTSPTPSGTIIAGTGVNNYNQVMNINVANVVPTSVENRPVNVALLWCIIYE